MSLIRMNFFSETLNMLTAANVILPLPKDGPAEDLPVLYLLHGLSDDHTSWVRQSAIERYALEHGLAVVMPDAGLSFYQNMLHGEKYNDYMALELPEIISSYFPVSRNREKTFIAGCSMGGFGALKIGLARPDNYSAIGCFSGANIEFRPDSRFMDAALYRAYENDIDFSDVIMAANARATAQGPYPVRIWHSWGDEDMLRTNAEKSKTFFETIASPMLSYEWEMLKGRHDWKLWDEMAEKFIRWLNLPAPKEKLY